MKWFHHDTDMHRNRKIRKLIRTHGATGYAFWCVLLEKLYDKEDGFQIGADELWFEDIAEDLKLGDYRTPIRILDTLAELGLIDKQLWQEHVISSPSITKRGDNYIIKRAQEAAKKQRYRDKQKAMSTVDTCGTKGQNAQMSPADPDSDLEFRSRDLIKKEELKITSNKHNIGDSGESQIACFRSEVSELIDPIDNQECISIPSGCEIKQPDPEVAKDQPQEESTKVALVTTQKATRKGECSAAANKSLSRKKQPTEWDDFKDLYNTRKPALWSAIEIVTKDRTKVFQNLIYEAGSRDKALEVLENALNYACEDSWYRTKTLSFENLKSNGKIFQLHERWLARVGVPMARMTEGNLALMDTYSNLMNILGGTAND